MVLQSRRNLQNTPMTGNSMTAPFRFRNWPAFCDEICCRVPTVLEKSLNFGFSLKSPWKWICPWKVFEFRGPSLKFQLVVLDFLFCVQCILNWKFEWIQQIKRYKSQFFPKKIGSLRSQQLTSWIFFKFLLLILILEQLLSYPSFPNHTYRYLCILCLSMYQSISKWAVSTLIVT